MAKRKIAFLLALSLIVMLVIGSMISADSSQDFGTNWTATYYNSTDLTGSVVYTEVLPNGININWGTGSPNAAVHTDNFSARFTSVQLFNAGTYEFVASSDDGIVTTLGRGGSDFSVPVASSAATTSSASAGFAR